MLTSKQRSYLRSLANTINPIIQIGKEGVNEAVFKQIDEALEARELVKISILRNSDYDTRQACEEICTAIGSEPVQVIGSRFVLYKKSINNPQIQLPAQKNK
jgi:RNA-binding protein